MHAAHTMRMRHVLTPPSYGVNGHQTLLLPRKNRPTPPRGPRGPRAHDLWHPPLRRTRACGPLRSLSPPPLRRARSRGPLQLRQPLRRNWSRGPLQLHSLRRTLPRLKRKGTSAAQTLRAQVAVARLPNLLLALLAKRMASRTVVSAMQRALSSMEVLKAGPHLSVCAGPPLGALAQGQGRQRRRLVWARHRQRCFALGVTQPLARARIPNSEGHVVSGAQLHSWPRGGPRNAEIPASLHTPGPCNAGRDQGRQHVGTVVVGVGVHEALRAAPRSPTRRTCPSNLLQPPQLHRKHGPEHRHGHCIANNILPTASSKGSWPMLAGSPCSSARSSTFNMRLTLSARLTIPSPRENA